MTAERVRSMSAGLDASTVTPGSTRARRVLDDAGERLRRRSVGSRAMPKAQASTVRVVISVRSSL